jgi:DNA-directed RNA polymerase subunit L
MKVDVQKTTDTYMKLQILDVDLSVMNAIRRIILSEIPNVSFGFDLNDLSNYNFGVNTTPLNNEFLAHRLSLVPIHFTADQIKEFDSDKYTFVIDKSNNTTSVMNVTTRDVKIIDNQTGQEDKDLAGIAFPPDSITGDYVLLNKLRPNYLDNASGETMKVDIVAKKDIALTNACFCPVSLAALSFGTDPEDSDNLFDSMKEKTNDLTRKHFDNFISPRHFKKNRFGEPTILLFQMETECKMSCLEILIQAIDILVDKLESITEVDVEANTGSMFTMCLPGHTHTIGNIIQSCFYNYFVREQVKGFENMIRIGYSCPHPLRPELLIEVTLSEEIEKSEEFAQELMEKGLEFLKKDIRELRENILFLK